ncbi:MAG TPA: HAD family phosphatase [Micromonosporaceae bacterium]|nr:HAD family phosphatase [Micromonosporaceae bacterium]
MRATSTDAAVVFDMDGVIVDSEPLWMRARQSLVDAAGGHWVPEAATAMMGVSSAEWSTYMRDRLGIPMTADEIRDDVVGRMAALYRQSLPLLPGAVRAVQQIAHWWPVGIASGSVRVLVDAVLESSGLDRYVTATVSSDEVAAGKPSPLVYLEVCRRLHAEPTASVAIEDSGNGIRSALAAGMSVVAIPRPGFEPEADVLQRATAVLPDLTRLDVHVITQLLAQP